MFRYLMNISLQNTQVLFHIVPHQAAFNACWFLSSFPCLEKRIDSSKKMKAKRRHETESLMHQEQSFTLPPCSIITLFFSNTCKLFKLSKEFNKLCQVLRQVTGPEVFCLSEEVNTKNTLSTEQKFSVPKHPSILSQPAHSKQPTDNGPVHTHTPCEQHALPRGSHSNEAKGKDNS